MKAKQARLKARTRNCTGRALTPQHQHPDKRRPQLHATRSLAPHDNPRQRRLPLQIRLDTAPDPRRRRENRIGVELALRRRRQHDVAAELVAEPRLAERHDLRGGELVRVVRVAHALEEVLEVAVGVAQIRALRRREAREHGGDAALAEFAGGGVAHGEGAPVVAVRGGVVGIVDGVGEVGGVVAGVLGAVRLEAAGDPAALAVVDELGLEHVALLAGAGRGRRDLQADVHADEVAVRDALAAAAVLDLGDDLHGLLDQLPGEAAAAAAVQAVFLEETEVLLDVAADEFLRVPVVFWGSGEDGHMTDVGGGADGSASKESDLASAIPHLIL